MKTTQLLSGLLALLISTQAFASNVHIYSDRKSETRFIRITESADAVGFSFCDRRAEVCEQIGARELYSKSEIRRKSRIELARAGAVGALDLGATILFAAGGAWVAGTTLAANSGLGTLGATMVGGGVVGATATQVLAWSVKKLNPRSYLKASSLARNSLAGRDQSVSDVVDYRDRLEALLSELN